MMVAESTSGKYKVLYDEQCEICQAGGSWLRILDKSGLIDLVPIEEPNLESVNVCMDEALMQLHVVAPDGKIYVGREAVTTLAMLFPQTKAVGSFFSFGIAAKFADLLYSFVARNRYALSKCRGGRCRTAQQEFKNAAFSFWTCQCIGLLMRLPLSIAAYWDELKTNYRVLKLTRHRRFDFLDGKLKMLFLNDFPSDIVPLMFGERFTTLVYDGVAIDPGGTTTRRAVTRYLQNGSLDIRAVAITHHHEEHVGNARWLADKLGVDLWVSQGTAALLNPPEKLPWSRRFIIGQPEPLSGEVKFIEDQLPSENGVLQVLQTPGHCDDELAFYDPKTKVLLAGDSFMGAYFSTPNPEVDSNRWIASLERVLELDIEILVEAHGQMHTLRQDIPDIPGVVWRQDPRQQLQEKLANLIWLREQVKDGLAEHMPIRAVEASCFPWVKSRNWESFLNDEVVRMLTSGDFCRTQMINSFSRSRDTSAVWPQVNTVQFICEKKN